MGPDQALLMTDGYVLCCRSQWSSSLSSVQHPPLPVWVCDLNACIDFETNDDVDDSIASETATTAKEEEESATAAAADDDDWLQLFYADSIHSWPCHVPVPW